MSNWIKVNEKMPEKYTLCWVQNEKIYNPTDCPEKEILLHLAVYLGNDIWAYSDCFNGVHGNDFYKFFDFYTGIPTIEDNPELTNYEYIQGIIAYMPIEVPSLKE